MELCDGLQVCESAVRSGSCGAIGGWRGDVAGLSKSVC